MNTIYRKAHRSPRTGCSLLALAAVLVAVSAAGDSRGLSAEERGNASYRTKVDLGLAVSGVANRSTRSAHRPTDRYEELLVERRPQAKDENLRLADVYVYDYQDNVLLHRIINPANGKVLFRDRLSGQQLPLTSKEADRAVQALLHDNRVRGQLNRELMRITGRPLNNFNGIDYKAVVFIADESERGRPTRCGEIRCAEILMYTVDDKIALDIRPIVELSGGAVLAVQRDRQR